MIRSGWQPLDANDRPWAGIEFVRVHLGMPSLDPDAFRGALRRLALSAPEVGRWLRVTPPSWAAVQHGDVGMWLDRVVDVSDKPADDPEAVVRLNGETLQDLPFRFLLGPDWMSVRVSHAVADGWTAARFLSHLVAVVGGATVGSCPWVIVPHGRRDRIVTRRAARHAPTLPYALLHRQQLAGGRYEPATVRADRLAYITVPYESRMTFAAELRAIRDAEFPGASVVALMTVALRAALAETLPAARPGFECLYNTRSEKDGTADAWGNWSAGVYLLPRDDWDPLAVTAAVQRARKRGLPELSSASLRARARRSSVDPVHMVAPEGAPRLTMSYLREDGRPSDPRVNYRCVVTATRPNGVESITVQANELAGRVTLSTAFFPDIWSREAVDAALLGFLHNPGAYLRRGRRSARSAA